MSKNIIVPNQEILEGVENLIYVPNKTFLGVNYDNPVSHHGGKMSEIYFGGGRTSGNQRDFAITLINSFQSAGNFIFSRVGYGTIHEGDMNTKETYLLRLPQMEVKEREILEDMLFGPRENVIEGSDALAENPTSSGLKALLKRLSLTELNGGVTVLSERQLTDDELAKIKSFGDIDRYVGLFNFSFGKYSERRLVEIDEDVLINNDGQTFKIPNLN